MKIPARFNQNTVELWRGRSRINGAEIVVLASGFAAASKNSKTGAGALQLIQTWILVAAVDPIEALRRGLDAAVCGACIFRPAGFDGARYWERECYVNIATAPLNMWRTWKAGRYWRAPLSALSALGAGRLVRLGSYGDPAAPPLAIWDALLSESAGHTGYTHQSASAKLRDVLKYCQVSADSLGDAEAARAAGVGSFRVLGPSEAPADFELTCPASAEAGKRSTCAECLLCSGFDGANVAIRSHGIGADLSPKRGTRRALALPVLNPSRAAMV